MSNSEFIPLAQRFRGFLPVVVDVETGGFNAQTDALLEVAAVMIAMNSDHTIRIQRTVSFHIHPFEGANLEPASLLVNGIDPYHPLRIALNERDALGRIFKEIREEVKNNLCSRAVLVGHNANFDLNFLNAAVTRCGIKRNPFHPFSCFDTVSLGAMAYGQTVLSRIAQTADISWDNNEAHSAKYDAVKTAEIFCNIINRWQHFTASQDKYELTLPADSQA